MVPADRAAGALQLLPWPVAPVVTGNWCLAPDCRASGTQRFRVCQELWREAGCSGVLAGAAVPWSAWGPCSCGEPMSQQLLCWQNNGALGFVITCVCNHRTWSFELWLCAVSCGDGLCSNAVCGCSGVQLPWAGCSCLELGRWHWRADALRHPAGSSSHSWLAAPSGFSSTENPRAGPEDGADPAATAVQGSKCLLLKRGLNLTSVTSGCSEMRNTLAKGQARTWFGGFL